MLSLEPWCGNTPRSEHRELNWRTYLFVSNCVAVPVGRITIICILIWRNLTGTARSKALPGKAVYLTPCITAILTGTYLTSLAHCEKASRRMSGRRPWFSSSLRKIGPWNRPSHCKATTLLLAYSPVNLELITSFMGRNPSGKSSSPLLSISSESKCRTPKRHAFAFRHRRVERHSCAYDR